MGPEAAAGSDCIRTDPKIGPIQVYSAASEGGRSFEVVPVAEEEAFQAPACWRLEYAGPMPVYVGVGVRIQVDFTTLASNVSVGSLSTLGFEAEADRLAGSLSAQTLGVTSRQISALMPVESELSLPAIQRVIEAVAAIKSNIYTDGNVTVPQILGFQSPLGRPAAVAALSRFVYGLDYRIDTVDAGDGKIGIMWPDLAASQPASTIPLGCPQPVSAANPALGSDR